MISRADITGSINDFISLFFPNICSGCGSRLIHQEYLLCTSCRYHLPRTYFHEQRENIIEKLFWGKVEVSAATSFLFFGKGNTVQRLIHDLKYHRKENIGTELGKLMATEIFATPPFSLAEGLVPVPLHPRKQRVRGYNQCVSIARGIQENSGIPLLHDVLERRINNTTQTKKNRLERWENVKNIFTVSAPEKVKGRRLVVIDDVITTGSTMEACVRALKLAGSKDISVATIACG